MQGQAYSSQVLTVISPNTLILGDQACLILGIIYENSGCWQHDDTSAAVGSLMLTCRTSPLDCELSENRSQILVIFVNMLCVRKYFSEHGTTLIYFLLGKKF